jgi:hypothetical protein
LKLSWLSSSNAVSKNGYERTPPLVAIAAGATGDMIEKVAAQMVAEKVVRSDRAEEILRKLKT